MKMELPTPTLLPPEPAPGCCHWLTVGSALPAGGRLWTLASFVSLKKAVSEHGSKEEQ